MNFYEHQALAKQQTERLLFLFAAALLCLIFLTALLLAGIGYIFGLYDARLTSYETGQSLWEVAAVIFNGPYLLTITLCVLVVVSLAAWFRTWQLKSGGRVIAEQLDGRLLNINPRTFEEKRLLNIVEEMAIASGVPMPSVYLIDEPGINAFAAGYQSADAVIGVTQGAVDALNRTELQGVIAHEFSHILNGDMRLNLRLIGFIFGIMAIATLGRYLLRSRYYSRSSRDKGEVAATLSVGLILMVLGYLGVLLGNLVKAAISRQREFLADASAVQFTRSQEGIANALRKIGGASHQQQWQQHNANEVSHMLFSQALRFHLFSGLLATHPPLDKRIKRINPQWDGEFVFQSTSADESSSSRETTNTAGLANFATNHLINAVECSGEITDHQIDYAEQQHVVLNKNFSYLFKSIHETYTARALVFAMLLDTSKSIQDQQLQDLKLKQELNLVAETKIIYQQLKKLTPSQPMMLLDLALPVLKQLSAQQYSHFREQMQQLIKIDKKIELREWALFYLIDYYCRSENYQNRSLASYQLKQRRPALARLLSAVASLSEPSSKKAEKIFHSISEKELGLKLRWYSRDEQNIQSLTQSLKVIRSLKALEKPRFLKACIKVIAFDNETERSELEVVRCIAQAMDCPMPYCTT